MRKASSGPVTQENDRPNILSLWAWQQPGGRRRQARAGLHPNLAGSASELMEPLVEVGVRGGGSSFALRQARLPGSRNRKIRSIYILKASLSFLPAASLSETRHWGELRYRDQNLMELGWECQGGGGWGHTGHPVLACGGSRGAGNSDEGHTRHLSKLTWLPAPHRPGRLPTETQRSMGLTEQMTGP